MSDKFLKTYVCCEKFLIIISVQFGFCLTDYLKDLRYEATFIYPKVNGAQEATETSTVRKFDDEKFFWGMEMPNSLFYVKKDYKYEEDWKNSSSICELHVQERSRWPVPRSISDLVSALNHLVQPL